MNMKNYASYLIPFIAGFLLCLYATKWGCVEQPVKYVDTGGWVQHDYKTDTLYKDREIPVPVTVYKTIKEVPKWLLDSLETLNYYNNLQYTSFWQDSLYYHDGLTDTIQFNTGITDSNSLVIPINYYEDSIRTPDYELKWKAETFGYLTSMVPEVTVFKTEIDTAYVQHLVKPRIPNWTIQAGISNRLNYKIGAGYKGWLIESEFNKVNFNQVYITKQFQF